jgi:energy-converting hydrogenase Eha subunit A
MSVKLTDIVCGYLLALVTSVLVAAVGFVTLLLSFWLGLILLDAH